MRGPSSAFSGPIGGWDGAVVQRTLDAPQNAFQGPQRPEPHNPWSEVVVVESELSLYTDSMTTTHHQILSDALFCGLGITIDELTEAEQAAMLTALNDATGSGESIEDAAASLVEAYAEGELSTDI